MLNVRRAAERGATRLDWLDSRHSFSFADYHDPRHMGFRTLRVINDDRVAPVKGFGTHFHRDMEIVSFVLEGELSHKDSMGNGSVIRPGDVQRMSAGTGVEHSEFNSSPTKESRFLQIWILPERRGLPPGYEQKAFPAHGESGSTLVASRDGRDGSVTIHQDAEIRLVRLGAGDRVVHRVRPGRGAWVQAARGAIVADGVRLEEGDGACTEDPGDLRLEGLDRAEALLFDLG